MSGSTNNSTQGSDAERLLLALQGSDEVCARQAASSLSRGELIELAHRAMRVRRWNDAAWILELLSPRDAGMQLKYCLARNLACLQAHRPDIYRSIICLPSDDRYGIGPSAGDQPTVIVRRPDGSRVSLSAGIDPAGASKVALGGLRNSMQQGLPIALSGIGDGYLLRLVADHPPALFMDMQLPIFLLEPDPQVLLQCLMIHDYTGPSGPIEQARFFWFIGNDWQHEMRSALARDLFAPAPAVVVNQGLEAQAIWASLQQLGEELSRRDQHNKDAIASYYGGVARSTLAEVFGANPPRQPRVLLMTTRFSTVLQYSTRDCAEAFRKMGWEARVLIEPSPAHRLLHAATRKELVEFKPDAVVQLDHLRYEHGDLFPPNLPFFCWIQDHLPNLRSDQAGPSLTETDFVLTDAPAMYASTFHYPRRQCIALPKLTREISTMRFTTDEKQTDQITFVSNASHVPEQIAADRLARHQGSAQGRALLESAIERIRETYAVGSTISTYHEVLGILRQAQRELSCMLSTSEFDAIAAWLTHPFNDALYRQQALGWAKAVARDTGLQLCLYGNGWEKHPEFAEFAQGPVEYGPELELVTRASRFNLQIVPYLCLHQRLLDGLMAGGFFLVRAHPADLAAPALLNFLHTYAPTAHSVADAYGALPPASVQEFHRLVEACRPVIATSDLDDPVAAVQDFAEMSLLVPHQQVLPRFDLNHFTDQQTFQAAVTRFLADPQLSDEIQVLQREIVAGRFTYEAGMRRVMRLAGDLLDENAGSCHGPSYAPSIQLENLPRRAV